MDYIIYPVVSNLYSRGTYLHLSTYVCIRTLDGGLPGISRTESYIPVPACACVGGEIFFLPATGIQLQAIRLQSSGAGRASGLSDLSGGEAEGRGV